MRRTATIGGADKNEATVRPAERGASGYRRFGPRSALRTDVVATGRPASVTTAAGLATVLALGGATSTPRAEAQQTHPALPGRTGSPAGAGSLATADAAQGTDEDVLSLLDLRHDDRDERELLRRQMALGTSDGWATDAAAPSSAEAECLALLNAERAKVGLPALALDGGLQAAAAAQAGNIASAGSLFHQDLVPLFGPWRTVGENVGFGPTVSSIDTALVDSPGHYANMVGPDFARVGIGVVVTADGRVWLSQVFGG